MLTREQNDDIPRDAVGAKFICERTEVANVSKWLAPLIPDNLKAIEAATVARALLKAVPASKGRRVMLSSELRLA